MFDRLVSVFERLSHQEIESEKLKSMQPLNRLPKVFQISPMSMEL